MLWWSDELKTGDERIDMQHKRIFELGEKVLDLSERSTTEEITKTFRFLLDYTEKHFKDEEELMERENYTRLLEHKELHAHFIEKLHQLLKRFKNSGVNEENVDELKVLMVGWLMNHINEEDRKFIGTL